MGMAMAMELCYNWGSPGCPPHSGSFTMWPAFLKQTNFDHLVKGKDIRTDMMSYAKELPEDPVDGGDGGDGGGVAHSLGEKLLPDLPGKHPCHKFYFVSSI